MKLTEAIALDSGSKKIDTHECFRSLPNSSLFLLSFHFRRQTNKKENGKRANPMNVRFFPSRRIAQLVRNKFIGGGLSVQHWTFLLVTKTKRGQLFTANIFLNQKKTIPTQVHLFSD